MKIILSIFLMFGVLLADREGGPYIGVGYGVSKYNDGGLYKKLKREFSGSLKIYGGAYINKHLSIELDYTSFNSMGIDNGFLEKGKTEYIDFSATSVSTLVHYPFSDDTLDLYAKVGVGQLDSSGVDEDGFTFVIGSGIGFRFNKYASMHFSYNVYNFKYNNLNTDTVHKMSIDYVYTAIEVQF